LLDYQNFLQLIFKVPTKLFSVSSKILDPSAKSCGKEVLVGY